MICNGLINKRSISSRIIKGKGRRDDGRVGLI